MGASVQTGRISFIFGIRRGRYFEANVSRDSGLVAGLAFLAVHTRYPGDGLLDAQASHARSPGQRGSVSVEHVVWNWRGWLWQQRCAFAVRRVLLGNPRGRWRDSAIS